MSIIMHIKFVNKTATASGSNFYRDEKTYFNYNQKPVLDIFIAVDVEEPVFVVINPSAKFMALQEANCGRRKFPQLKSESSSAKGSQEADVQI